MKIYGSKPPENQGLYLKTQKTGGENQVAGQIARPAASDRVNLSPQAKEIAESKSIVNSLPEIRVEKVEAIQKAIANGTYRIDSMKIAGKMIDEMV